ncbi:MAG: DUF4320 family protein [Clostridium sp.]|jgi:hypothetical protein|nr:DUF4320 family protein [Clostridium sp.]
MGAAPLKKKRSLRQEEEGAGYLDAAVFLFVACLSAAFLAVLAQVFVQKYSLDLFAAKAMRAAEIAGNTDVTGVIDALKARTGLDPVVRWSASYYSGTKVQLNTQIRLTLTAEADIGFFAFGSFPVPLRAQATGYSEVYYK